MSPHQPKEPATVELAPIPWLHCDGASVEEYDGTLRIVLYVTDIEPGKEPQQRVAGKFVMPVRGGLEMSSKVEDAARCFIPETSQPEASARTH